VRSRAALCWRPPPTPPHRGVVSPGGSRLAVPGRTRALVALDFAFRGGAARIPRTSRASPTGGPRSSDEAPATSIPRRSMSGSGEGAEDQLSANRDQTWRGTHALPLTFDETRVAAARADRRAFRYGRHRQPFARSSCRGPPRGPEPNEMATSVVGDRLRGPSIWPDRRGTLESVHPFTAADLKGYAGGVRRDYPQDWIVGEIDPARRAGWSTRCFGGLPARRPRTPVAKTSPQGLGARRSRLTPSTFSSQCCFIGGVGSRATHGLRPASIVNQCSAAARFRRGSTARCAEARGLPIGVPALIRSITRRCS